jgi:ClpP class serine protease
MRYTLADLSEMMFNRPVAITREKAEIILGALGPRLNIGSLTIAGEERVRPIAELAKLAADARVEFDSLPGDREVEQRDWETGAVLDPYAIWNGVAVLKVRGTLVPEGGLNPTSGLTSYQGIDYKRRYAEADDRVLGIALDIDSGGGTVVDCFELCNRLLETREKKPIRAIIRGVGASAAYAIAACSTDVTCAPYSLVGSIGTLIAHAEFSESLKQDGIGVTLIQSAAHKTDGHPALPLAPEVAERLQLEVDRSAQTFIELVAKARGM